MNEMTIPLFRDVRYLGKVNVCTKNGFIFSYENATYSMHLFNVMIGEEGNAKACELLLNAPHVEIEIDQYASTRQGVEAYAFVDDILLQQFLIENQMARIKLRNPEYKYYQQMVEMESKQVSFESEILNKNREYNREKANKFIQIQLILILVVILMLFLRIFIKKVK